MALVKHISARVEIPHEDGEWLQVRKLSRKELQDARDLAAAKMRQTWREMTGDVITAIQGLRRVDAEAAEADPFAGYDEEVVLKAGIIDWSYPDKRVNPYEQLDEETATWAYQEVLKFSGIGAGEDERKNG